MGYYEERHNLIAEQAVLEIVDSIVDAMGHARDELVEQLAGDGLTLHADVMRETEHALLAAQGQPLLELEHGDDGIDHLVITVPARTGDMTLVHGPLLSGRPELDRAITRMQVHTIHLTKMLRDLRVNGDRIRDHIIGEGE